jgi:hypothetical protein
MFKNLATVACLASTTYANINVDFDEVLTGKSDVTSEVFKKLWNHFESEFTSPMQYNKHIL